MASREMWDVLQQAEQLPPGEQLELAGRLVERIRHLYGDEMKPKRRRDLLELEGAAQYPLVGEDAQEWVSRTRREGDEHREQVLRGDGILRFGEFSGERTSNEDDFAIAEWRPSEHEVDGR